MQGKDDAEHATRDWDRAYGPLDGPWLRAEFAHPTSDLTHLANMRIARVDDRSEMARYQRQVEGEEAAVGCTGDWELTSPATGIHYRMGRSWRD